MRYHVRIRRFLNRLGHESGAHIMVEVPDSSTCPSCCEHGHFDECRGFVLRIADCSRVVSLDFGVDTARDRRNGRHKLDVLIDALQQFRVAFEIECARAAECPRRR